MEVVSYSIIGIIAWLFIIIKFRRKNDDNLHPMVVFLLFYILNYPVKMIATKYGIHLIDSNAFGEHTQILALILSDISTMLIIAIFSYKPKIKGDLNERLWSGTYDFWNASIFFVALFILSGRIVYGRGSVSRMFSLTAMMDYRAYRSTENIGGGVAGVFGVVMTISMYAFIYLGVNTTMRKPIRKKLLFLGVVAMLTWYGYAQTLAKTTLLMTPIAFIISCQMCSKRSGGKGIPLRWIGVVGMAGLFAVAVMELTDVMEVREVTGSRAEALLNSFFNPSFDAPDNLTAILNRMDNIWIGELKFIPFLYNLFLSKIPRAIWPGKSPVNGKIMIVREFLPEFYVNDRQYNSASPSIVGDGLASGGLIFVLVLSAAYGILFYNLYQKAVESDNLISNLLYIYFIANLNNFCRGGSDIFGNLLYYYVLTCLICVLYKSFNRIRIYIGRRYDTKLSIKVCEGEFK